MKEWNFQEITKNRDIQRGMMGLIDDNVAQYYT